MSQIVFRNLAPSDLTRAFVEERLSQLTAKFPDLRRNHLRVTLRMENSPVQAGPDLFTITLAVGSGRYRGVRLQKSALHFYQALSELMEAMLERLNRWGDRERVRFRQQERRFLRLSAVPILGAPSEGPEDDDYYEEEDERRAMP